MTRFRPMIIALTLAVIGLASVADARDRGDDNREYRDGITGRHAIERRHDGRRFDGRRHWRAPQSGIVENGERFRAGDDSRSARFEQRFDDRKFRQKRRIRRGLRDGDLTRREARRLGWQQQRIDRLAERYRRDGRLSKRERRRLNKAQRRAGSAIGAARHDDHPAYRPRDLYRHGRR